MIINLLYIKIQTLKKKHLQVVLLVNVLDKRKCENVHVRALMFNKILKKDI